MKSRVRGWTVINSFFLIQRQWHFLNLGIKQRIGITVQALYIFVGPAGIRTRALKVGPLTTGLARVPTKPNVVFN